MKWIALFVALSGILPIVIYLRNNPAAVSWLFIPIAFIPFCGVMFPQVRMALVQFEGRPGLVQDMGLSIIDILAFCVVLATPSRPLPLAFKVIFGLYTGALLLSMFQAQSPAATWFFVWQFLRVVFVAAVIFRAATDDAVPTAILTGLACGVCLEAVLALWQRAHGEIQAVGTFAHQNTLGMIVNLVMIPFFALVLSGSRQRMVLLVPAAGLIAAVLTTSRGTIGLCAAGLALCFLLVSARRFTFRTAAVGLAGAIGVLALAPIVISSFQNRFAATAVVDDYDEREAFEKAAALIFADFPLGVGANHYVVTAKFGGYSDQAGVHNNDINRSAHVHNAYWLAAAETGYPGIITFVLMLLYPLYVALRAGWRAPPGDLRGVLLLGFASALTVVYFHNFVEWIFFDASVQYLFGIVSGLIAALAAQLGYWQREPTPAELRAERRSRYAAATAPARAVARRRP